MSTTTNSPISIAISSPCRPRPTCPKHRFIRYKLAGGTEQAPRVGLLLADDDDSDEIYSPSFTRRTPPMDDDSHADDATTLTTIPTTMSRCMELYTDDDNWTMTRATTGARLRNATLLSPVDADAKIACVGKNYLEHVGEVDSTMPGISREAVPELPIVFPKASTSAVGYGENVDVAGRKDVDYEGELCVVIGRETKNIPEEMSEDDIIATYVGGWTIANDVTARVLQKSHQQWFLGKSCDTFCPLGPWIVGAAKHSETSDDDNGGFILGSQRLTTKVNGEIRQDSTIDKMIFSVARLVAITSRHQTLRPGDVFLTGTPSGVGAGCKPVPKFLRDGDVVEIEIEGIGALVNPIVDSASLV